MLVGHLGLGLGLKARYPSVPLVAIFVATQLPDLLLVIFNLAGWETLGEGPTHLLHPTNFDAIPFSHDFSMVAMYAGLGASVGLLLWSSRWALAIGWGIASHIVLDWLVHAPDIGLIGPWVPLRSGLDLWTRAPLAAWALELLVVLAGGALYLRGRRHQVRAWALPGSLVLVHVAALLVW